MSLETLGPLILFVLASTISPGGATALATASGANFGWRRSLPLIAGISLGLALMAAAAAAGLGGILAAVPSLQLAMKAVGSVYLLWLAWQTARRAAPQSGKTAGRPSSLLGGAFLVWQNPKGWAMTLSAAASFGAVSSGAAAMAGLLATVFAVFSALSLTIWCVGGLLLARLLRSERQWRVLNIALGLLLLASIVPIWL